MPPNDWRTPDEIRVDDLFEQINQQLVLGNNVRACTILDELNKEFCLNKSIHDKLSGDFSIKSAINLAICIQVQEKIKEIGC